MAREGHGQGGQREGDGEGGRGHGRRCCRIGLCRIAGGLAMKKEERREENFGERLLFILPGLGARSTLMLGWKRHG